MAMNLTLDVFMHTHNNMYVRSTMHLANGMTMRTHMRTHAASYTNMNIIMAMHSIKDMRFIVHPIMYMNSYRSLGSQTNLGMDMKNRVEH